MAVAVGEGVAARTAALCSVPCSCECLCCFGAATEGFRRPVVGLRRRGLGRVRRRCRERVGQRERSGSGRGRGPAPGRVRLRGFGPGSGCGSGGGSSACTWAPNAAPVSPGTTPTAPLRPSRSAAPAAIPERRRRRRRGPGELWGVLRVFTPNRDAHGCSLPRAERADRHSVPLLDAWSNDDGTDWLLHRIPRPNTGLRPDLVWTVTRRWRAEGIRTAGRGSARGPGRRRPVRASPSSPHR